MKTKTRFNKLTAWLLTLAMLMTFIPSFTLSVSAADTNSFIGATSVGADIIANGNKAEAKWDFVYFGTYNNSPIKWRVLSKTGNGGTYKDAAGNAVTNAMFLLSEYGLANKHYETAYYQDDNDGQEYPAMYQNSDIQLWLKGDFTNNSFTENERDVVLKTTKTDAAETVYGIEWAETKLVDDTAFLISTREAYDFISEEEGLTSQLIAYQNDGTPKMWWLRSNYPQYSVAVFDSVITGGMLASMSVVDAYTGKEVYVRPAINLHSDNILFTSAAVDGKPKDFGLLEPLNSNEYKLTMKDSERSGFATEVLKTPDNKLHITYSNAKTGENEYISAVAKNADGDITRYGRLAKVEAASGTLEYDISGITLADGESLYIFNEQYNGDYKTDFASELQEITITEAKWGASADSLTNSGTLAEAFSAAAGNASIKYIQLASNVSTDNGLIITGGAFTLDLAGCELTSSVSALTFKNSAKVTICDTSDAETGMISSSTSNEPVLWLHDSSEVILESGTISGIYYAIYMSFSGMATQSKLTINGGTITVQERTAVVIVAMGDSVDINGGTIVGRIAHHTGTVDFSDHLNPKDMVLRNETGSEVSASAYKLPEGFYFADMYSGDKAETLEAYKNYQITSIASVLKITDLTFNSDSPAYDAETNTFTVSEENPLILTVTGENLIKFDGYIGFSNSQNIAYPFRSTLTGAQDSVIIYLDYLQAILAAFEYEGFSPDIKRIYITETDYQGRAAELVLNLRIAGDTSATPKITGISFNNDSEAYNAKTNTFTVAKDAPFVAYLTGENFVNIDDAFLEKISFGFVSSVDESEDAYGNSLSALKSAGLVSVDADANTITLTFDYDMMKVFVDEYGTFEGICYGDIENVQEENIKSVNIALAKNDHTKPTNKGGGLQAGGSSSSEKAESKPTTPDVSDTTEESTSKIFADVHDTGHWAKDDIDYVSEKGLMNGISENSFAPDGKVTRAMLVTVLYRNEGEPATNRSIPFADVDLGAYYGNAVIWAKQNGIVKGISETEFAPDAYITREQIAAIMFRYAQYKGMEAITLEENLHFADADEISEYAVSAMNWAVGKGLMNGKTESTINPKDNATRAEIAAILHRFIENNK